MTLVLVIVLIALAFGFVFAKLSEIAKIVNVLSNEMQELTKELEELKRKK